MIPNGSSFFTVSDRPPLDRGGPETGPIVIWPWGKHDASADSLLCLTLERAIAFDRAGLVLDMTRQRSASLTVRTPSAPARRSMDACGLTDMVSPDPEMAGALTGKALGSWVAVPAVERSDGRPGRSAVVPSHVPEHLGCTSAL
jgi:hypothetical protein